MIGISLAMSLGNPVLRGPGDGFDPDASALFARMSVQPSAEEKAAYDALIIGIKADGLWGLLDRLLIYGVHDAQAGRRNIRRDLYNSTEVASPDFLAYAGYAGDGVSSYLNTGYAPGVSAGVATQNSNFSMVWSLTESVATSAEQGNSINSQGLRSATGNWASRNMNSNVYSATATSSLGCYIVSRTASASYERYINGVIEATASVTSATPPSDVLYDCARNNAGVLTTPSSRRLWATANGSGLTGTQAANLYSRLNTFKTAIGA